MDIIIVCHTEFGFVVKKRVIFEKKAKQGVREGVPSLLKLAKKYQAKITFAVCPEVVDCFPQETEQEIGLHLHPGWEEFKWENFKWNVGDQYLKEHYPQKTFSTALKNHPYEDQYKMIEIGKELLEKKLKVKPKVFVAGRSSLNNDTVRALIENGFFFDCSPEASLKTDHFDWSKLPRICLPYRPDSNNYQKEGNLPLLIIPVSQTIFRLPVAPESARICGLPWLKACFLEYYHQEVPLFHISLHSPTMTDSYYLSLMDNFLSFITSYKNVHFKFVSEIKEYPRKNFKSNISPYLFALNREVFKTIFRKLLR